MYIDMGMSSVYTLRQMAVCESYKNSILNLAGRATDEVKGDFLWAFDYQPNLTMMKDH